MEDNRFLTTLLLAYIEHHRIAIRQKVRRIHLQHSLAGLFVITVLLVATWSIGNFYGSRYQLQGSIIAGRSSDTVFAQLIKSKLSTYKLAIEQPDHKQVTYSLQDMGLQVDIDKSISEARAQQSQLSSRLQWWHPLPLKLTIRADSKAFQTFVTNHATLTIHPAQDASLRIVDGVTQVVDGAPGKQYGFANPTGIILESASTLQTAPLQMRETIQQPLVSAQSLAKAKDQLDATLKQSVVFTIDGQQIKPTSTDIASWVVYTPGSQKGNADIQVDVGKVQAYIGQLVSSRSHPPRAQISFSNGVSIPGSAGIVVTGKDAATENIKQNLLKNQGLRIDLPVQRQTFKVIAATPAARWLEVDITNKRMYAYQQTDLVKTFLVSAGAPRTPTVTGTYAIYSKYTKQTMSGPNTDGSRYVQPNVPWVNYFYRDYAIHGNYWRPASYFGNVNSSHGCVGVTPGDGAWIYNWASVGTPVIVHT